MPAHRTKARIVRLSVTLLPLPPFARNRIETARRKRVAPTDAQHGQARSVNRSVETQGFLGVARARRLEAARGPEERSQSRLVQAKQRDKD